MQRGCNAATIPGQESTGGVREDRRGPRHRPGEALATVSSKLQGGPCCGPGPRGLPPRACRYVAPGSVLPLNSHIPAQGGDSAFTHSKAPPRAHTLTTPCVGSGLLRVSVGTLKPQRGLPRAISRIHHGFATSGRGQSAGLRAPQWGAGSEGASEGHMQSLEATEASSENIFP